MFSFTPDALSSITANLFLASNTICSFSFEVKGLLSMVIGSMALVGVISGGLAALSIICGSGAGFGFNQLTAPLLTSPGAAITKGSRAITRAFVSSAPEARAKP